MYHGDLKSRIFYPDNTGVLKGWQKEKSWTEWRERNNEVGMAISRLSQMII